jgi:hypothetical protein
MIYSVDSLLHFSRQTSVLIDGRYVPLRPYVLRGLYGLKIRITAAWLCLTGKADAVTWEGQ